MSMDKSLVSKGKLKRQRSVLTRAERIERLIEEERWEEGRSAFGLPKVKTRVVKRGKKKAEDVPAEEAAESAEAEGATGASEG